MNLYYFYCICLGKGGNKRRSLLSPFARCEASFFSAFGLALCAMCSARPTLLPLPSSLASAMCEDWCQRCFGVGKHVLLPVSWKYFPHFFRSCCIFFVKERFFFVAISLICGFISQHFLLSPPCWGRAMAKPSIWLRCGQKKKIKKTNLFLQYLSTIQGMLPTIWI